MTNKIDKGVPIPRAARGPRSQDARTALQMADGDSVFKKTFQEAERFRDVLQYYGFKAVTRRRYVEDHGEEGYRIWKKECNNANPEKDSPADITSPPHDPLQRGTSDDKRKDNKRLVKPSGDSRSNSQLERGVRSVGKGTRY